VKAEYHLLLKEILQTSLAHTNSERSDLLIHYLAQDVAFTESRATKEGIKPTSVYRLLYDQYLTFDHW
jgi:hypothetical protein